MDGAEMGKIKIIRVKFIHSALCIPEYGQKIASFLEMYFSRNHGRSKQKFAELKKLFLCDIIFKETFPKGERRFGI